MKPACLFAALLLLTATPLPAASVPFTLTDSPQGLQITWDAHSLSLSAAPDSPLITDLRTGEKIIAQNLTPEFRLIVGSRQPANQPPQFPGFVFFDNPHKRPYQTHAAILTRQKPATQQDANHLTVDIGELTAGPFKGRLLIHLYAGSPLIQIQAAMAPDQPGTAYLYDAVVHAPGFQVAFQDVDRRWKRIEKLPTEMTSAAASWRTILGVKDGNSLAVFPPPHAFFFPRDKTDNLQFIQYGNDRLGIRQDERGGGNFVPWIDAPPGKSQLMDLFLLPVAAGPEAALESVKKYTRDDHFKPMPGRLTYTSHYHARLAVNELTGKSTAGAFAATMRRMGVNLVHLSEFHGDGHIDDPGEIRLREMQAMFEICNKYSGDGLLLMPGEEGNKYLAHPWPVVDKKIHPGHWMCYFPRPVYFTWVRKPDQPFVEQIAPHGKVYHLGDREDMLKLLELEAGLAWSAHPRIKASFAAPDAFKDQPWFKGPHWLGGAWKAMPANLADDRLGRRVLDLLDEMSNWATAGGYDFKRVPGEVDVFEIDPTHELYGHMNINYLKLAQMPTLQDWSSVLDVLRRGDFFTTTGEILIHDFTVQDGSAHADLEWTFPPAFAELITGDGREVHRQRISLTDQKELSRGRFEWKLTHPTDRWVRLEVWDAARNGAYTQVVEP